MGEDSVSRLIAGTKLKFFVSVAVLSLIILPLPLFLFENQPGANVKLLSQDVSIQSSNIIENFSVPTPNSGPNAIVSGPNRTLWFVEFTAGKIGEFFSSNDSFHEFTIPESGAIPVSLAIDQSGTIWFSDQKNGSASIWSLKPSTGKFTQYLIPTPKALPLFIVIDSEQNIWFTETTGYKLGELTYPNYSLTEYPVPVSQFEPLEMVLDQNKSLIWITLAETTSQVQPGMIASFNMTSKKFVHLYNPPFSVQDPVGIVLDKNGDIWTSEHRGSAITELIPSNSTWRKYQTSLPPASFQLPISAPATLAIDGQGNLWFVEHFSNRVGILSPRTGIIQEFNIPGPGGPYAYSVLNTLDPDGNFWFTNFGANSIDMIPGNVTTNISTTAVASNEVLHVQAGQSISADFQVKNTASETRILSLNATSSFSEDGSTSSQQVSYNVTDNSIQLGSNDSTVIKALVTPPVSLPSGIYSVSLILSGESSSTIQTFFISVNASPLYFLYHLGEYFQYIIISAIVIVAAVYLSIRRGIDKKRFIEAKTENTPERSVKS